MTYSNFTNGTLVLRVWKFDGDTELLAKFQCWDHAEMFAKSLFDRDLSRRAEIDKKPLGYFYISVCENECRVRVFAEKDT